MGLYGTSPEPAGVETIAHMPLACATEVAVSLRILPRHALLCMSWCTTPLACPSCSFACESAMPLNHESCDNGREPLLLMLGHLTANLRETVRNQRPNAAATLPQLQPLQSALLQPKPEQPLLQPKLSAQSPPACQAQKPRSHRPRPRN